jgi:hypothetical protein
MPALSNPRHEVFAQHLFKGLSAAAALERAGYARNYGNAVRLKRNEKVRARVAELQAEAAKKVTDEVSFNAVDMFKRLEHRIEAAEAAGDHKTALDGTKFMISCFGYEDSPTLTHEHVAGKPLQPSERKTGEAEQPVGQVVRFPKAIAAMIRTHAK